ncbi:hypothetical protein M407DRAFT_21065 [Tulasnella calospora MUT 4182]|uniref:Uncharacterized protein n=1 Tax=Tulasnella calospora MUT 4182 TaxID=1051891 RepID=A0A0C3QQI2_9AGAM|nr:hypothetical protein M407DRAFT_21065 [Tulasnella calospora MUT 4182]
MADSNPDELVFRGSSPEECETFVSTIRKRALAEKKHRDDEWIAYLASSCFVGDAFYWYEDLDKEIQDDWSRLRPALVARIAVSQVSVPPITIPTPAAAPPAPNSIPMTRKGRLKVLGLNGRFRGYVAARIEDGKYRSLTDTAELALSVLLTPPASDNAFEIKVASEVSTASDAVGITWSSLTDTQWVKNTAFIAVCCSWSTVKSTTTWAVERDIWKLSDDSELSVQYPKPSGG